MDRFRDTLLEALGRALAAPGEHRLYRAGKLAGLFAGRAGPGGEAAALALREGLLERRVEVKGKTEIDWVRLTPAGVEYLHANESPTRALYELRDTLRANQAGIPVWLDEMRNVLRAAEQQLTADAGRWLDRLRALEARVGEALRRLEAAGPLLPDDVARDHPWAIDALNYLDRRRTVGATDDCPLPELFEATAAHHPALSLPAFHDGLRQLHRRRAVLLREAAPEQLARPEFALLDEAMMYYFAAR